MMIIIIIKEWNSKNTDCGGIQIRPPNCGNRIIIELLWDIAPLACENFATLCANGSSSSIGGGGGAGGTSKQKVKPPPIGTCGKPMTYRNSKIHRLIQGFIMQGGDYVFGNGSGGESIYNGKKFKDEKQGLQLKHNRKGIVSMGNSGKNSNTSQFFITLTDQASQCDGKHVIFGNVISGYDLLSVCETFGSSSNSDNHEPSVPITITDCGVWVPFATPPCGYWYDQPDIDSFSGISPTFVVRPRVAIVVPSDVVLAKFQKAMGTYAMITPMIAPSTTEEDEEGKKTIENVNELLSNFKIDVVIVAPVCNPIMKSIVLPQSWSSSPLSLQTDEVIMEAKPIEALSCLKNKAWICTKKIASWTLELEFVQ